MLNESQRQKIEEEFENRFAGATGYCNPKYSALIKDFIFSTIVRLLEEQQKIIDHTWGEDFDRNLHLCLEDKAAQIEELKRAVHIQQFGNASYQAGKIDGLTDAAKIVRE